MEYISIVITRLGWITYYWSPLCNIRWLYTRQTVKCSLLFLTHQRCVEKKRTSRQSLDCQEFTDKIKAFCENAKSDGVCKQALSSSCGFETLKSKQFRCFGFVFIINPCKHKVVHVIQAHVEKETTRPLSLCGFYCGHHSHLHMKKVPQEQCTPFYETLPESAFGSIQVWFMVTLLCLFQMVPKNK